MKRDRYIIHNVNTDLYWDSGSERWVANREEATAYYYRTYAEETAKEFPLQHGIRIERK